MFISRQTLLLVLLSLVMAAQQLAAQCTYNLSAQTTNVSCFGANDGAIDLSVTGGTGPFSYQWPGGQTDEDVNGLTSGVYVVTVTDGLGCISNLAREVKEPAAIVIGLNSATINCFTPTVNLLASVQGGTGPYSYLWSNGEVDDNASIYVPGPYHVTVVDANGCSQTAQTTVLIDTVAPVADAGPDKLLDCQTAQVQLGGPGSSSGPDISYLWIGAGIQNGANGNSLEQFPLVNIPGTYTLEVSSFINGCHASDQVTVGGAAPPVANAGINRGLPCGGGQITLDGSGSSQGANYVHTWQGLGPAFIVAGANTLNPTVNTAGLYVLYVTDITTGCEKLDTVKVFPGPIVGAAEVSIQDVSCSGQLGVVFFGPVVGTPPYTYQWSDGSTNQSLTNVPPGLYSLTVTDATGCSRYGEYTIGQGTPWYTVTALKTAPACSGLSNGSIDLTVGGLVVPPVQFAWSNGATTEDLSGLAAGTYKVTVTDQATCSTVLNITLADPPAFTLDAVVVGQTSCFTPNGAIDLTVTPTGTYSYLWQNGSTFQDISGLVAGTYTVTVSNTPPCTQTASFVINPPPAIILSGVVTDAACTGLCDGKIQLSVSGGIPPLEYAWSPGETTQNLLNQCSGTYTVTVYDAVSCSATKTFVINTQSSSITLSLAPTNATCNGLDGAIDLTVSGGVPPFQYHWSDGNNLQNCVGIPGGTYTVTVTDATGCTKTGSAVVGQNSSINLFINKNNVLCFGGSNGSVDLTVTGGAPPYTYLWSNNATTQDLNNLPAGTYTVIVTDQSQCTKAVSVTISQPTALNITSNVVAVACNGGANGLIDLTVSGGTPAYTYVWSNNATNQDLNGVFAGSYTVTVTDANGCTKTASVTVTQPTSITTSFVVTQAGCNGQSNGAIDLTVNGGVPGYTYTWSNGANTQDINNLPTGTYTVTITDANNCSKTNSYTVTSPAPLTFDIVSLSNTCSSETLTGPVNPNYTYLWTGPANFTSNTAAITAYVSGVYTLEVTNGSSCTATDTYPVNLLGNGTCGAIKGRVFHDVDESCSLNGTEPGLGGWIVRATSNTDTIYDVTDAQGRYLLAVPLGTYALKVIVPNLLWNLCPGGAPVSVNIVGDTIAGGDFPVQSVYSCPALTVNIGTERLRRCSSNNYYEVEYCNLGTQTATNAYVTVVLDPFLTLMSASVPYTDLGANSFQVNVGDLSIGECGSFSMQVFVGCNTVLGQSHCSSASIYPDTLCSPGNALWSGASLQVKGLCDNDSLRFTIKNVGKASMATIADYIVVEDGIMFRQGILPPLVKGDSMTLSFPANGSTWRVEVDQEAYHPYPSPVGLSVEGCSVNANFSTGFVNQFPLPDESPALDIDCTANVGSYDPNDKQGYPLGYGAEHFIRPGTDIEYLIRFQNTGTDTAFRVEIIDTLSTWLDPETIRFGTSSHAYRYDLDGNGVAHFIFENIMLPDSNVNEPASHGYAKFAIKPRADAPLDARIENTAAIYFDQNQAVYTNTTYHVLQENFITVGSWEPQKPEIQIVASPNPFSESTRLTLKGFDENVALTLQVFDLRGRMLREVEGDRSGFLLQKADLQAGIYGFRVVSAQQLIGSGKLVVE